LDHIFQEGNAFSGRIVYIAEDQDDHGTTAKRDVNNPDPDLRGRALLGSVILKDLQWDGEQWGGGEIYDPKSGNTYSCLARLQPDGTLYFKGYIGLSIIGKSTIWSRFHP
jgi:uncharacterized protein (DUF2147 family)